jgi:AcrR family transcriptional regulator
MVRLAKYNEDNFIDSAIAIAAQCGMGAVSMASIASKTGAPVGSLYHRFDSRGTVLARSWLKVRADFRDAVLGHWERGDTWAAVAALLQWCRSKPAYARFMLQTEAAPDFGELAAPLHAELEADQALFDAAFERCLLTMPATLDDPGHLLRFVLIGAPVAIVNPFLNAEQPIPPSIDVILRASHDAVCGWSRHST